MLPGAANTNKTSFFSSLDKFENSSSLTLSSFNISFAFSVLLNLSPKVDILVFNPSNVVKSINSLGILLSVNSFL